MTGAVKVDYETRTGGRIARLTIDNAARLNTLNSPLMESFAEAAARLAADEALRAVVVTGAGDRAFVGGADIDEMAGLDAASGRAFWSSPPSAASAISRSNAPRSLPRSAMSCWRSTITARVPRPAGRSRRANGCGR